MTKGIQRREESRFYHLLLVVCALGCQYVDKDAASNIGLDAAEFQNMALKRIEANMLIIYEDSDLMSIQICVLLGSFYLYTGRPNLGFVVLGSGIRCAYAVGLHRESIWPRLAREEVEERRRVWWALYIFDRYASIVYGHPYGIREGEFAVNLPQNLDDTSQRHGYGTMLPNPDGRFETVTVFTYITFKIQLYRISSPILKDLYFHPSSDRGSMNRTIQELDERLCQWRESLPPELRLDKIRDQWLSSPVRDCTFYLQALTLQLAYDNMVILLHRPLLHKWDARSGVGQAREQTSPHTSHHVDSSNNTYHSGTRAPRLHTDDYSRDRCLGSASRSAKLCDSLQCLKAARHTHAVAYLGINLFTAGLVLCTVALSKPISSMAQKAKAAIRKILIISEEFKNDTPIASQSKQILTDLVKLILDRELLALTSTDSEQLSIPSHLDAERNSQSATDAQRDPMRASAFPQAQHPLDSEVVRRDLELPESDTMPSGSLWDNTAVGTVAASDNELPSSLNFNLFTGIDSLQTC